MIIFKPLLCRDKQLFWAINLEADEVGGFRFGKEASSLVVTDIKDAVVAPLVAEEGYIDLGWKSLIESKETVF